MVNANSIVTVVVLFCSLIVAVILGNLVVTDQTTALIWIGVVSVLVLCFGMGRNIWFLIPATMYMEISFPWLPAQLPLSQLAVMLVIGWSLILVAMRRLPLQFRMTSIEWAALLVMVSVAQAFLRNPVGLNVLGSESIGAKPYWNVLLALIAGAYLSLLKVPMTRVRNAMRFMLSGMFLSSVISVAAYFSGSVAMVTGRYLGIWGKPSENPMTQAYNQVTDPSAATRNQGAEAMARFLSLAIVSKRNPFFALIHPFWGFLVLATCAAAGLSGFRNVLISTGLTFAFATYYWGRARALCGATMLGLVCILLLNVVNLATPLPPNVQRALSFLPGTWEEQYVVDAQGSTEWRVEMWRLALTTDRYIQNKVIGDGLGLSREQFEFMSNMEAKVGLLSNSDTQDIAMMAGDYHSGPVSTIRATGYVGLGILLYAMILTSVRAHRLITRTRGTEWFGSVLVLALPAVWSPIFFVFIFGSFGSGVVGLLMQMGLLRLIEKSLAGEDEQPLTVGLEVTNPMEYGGNNNPT